MMNNPYKIGMQAPYGYPGYNPLPPVTPYPSGPVPAVPAGSFIPGVPALPSVAAATGLPPIEESYIENILRMNLGKMATIYMTFENNTQWNAKIYKGKLEAAGRDHIIISDPTTGMRYLLLMVNLDYITFDEPLNYAYPFQPVQR